MHTSHKELVKHILESIYPVGSIYISTVSTSPAELIGGTWQAINGRFLVAQGSNGKSGNEALNLSAGATGGETNHTLTVNEMPNHAGHVDPVGTGHGTAAGKYLGDNVNVSTYGSAGRGWDVIQGNEIVPHRENRGGGVLTTIFRHILQSICGKELRNFRKEVCVG